jgi:hypothetical protein
VGRGDPPPRAGNALEVLIDGASYFPALEQAIRCARRSVLIAGWCITPGFAVVRDEPPVLLRELLGEAAGSVDVRVLLWAPVPVFAPRRASVRAGRDELVRGTRIKAALDSNERPMHCHHEKLVVIDDELAFVGGIDLTDLGGDRYDTPEHPGRGRMGWHDVASRLRGPAVADVGRHVAQRWQAVTGERLEAQPTGVVSAGDVELQIVRTVPEKLYEFAPRGDFRIIEEYLRALRSARHLVYLENQFLWSPEIVNILADKLRRPPADDFRVVMMLPGRPNTGEDDTRAQLALLAEADGDQGRFLATTIRARSGNTTRPRVRAREGRDRRRPLAHARLREPQRPLLLQRHRGQRRHLRRFARTRHPTATVGRPSRTRHRRDRRRPEHRHRRTLAPDRRRAARAPQPRCAADPQAGGATSDLTPFRTTARPTASAPGRRLAARPQNAAKPSIDDAPAIRRRQRRLERRRRMPTTVIHP